MRPAAALILPPVRLLLSRSLKGVFDLRPALSAVQGGYCLNSRQLEGIANTLAGKS